MREAFEAVKPAWDSIDKVEDAASVTLTLTIEGVEILRMVFAKDKGYLLEFYENRDRDGDLVNRVSVDIKMERPGVYYPAVVEHLRWNPEERFNEQEPYMIYTAQYSGFDFETVHPDEFFTIEGLNVIKDNVGEKLLKTEPSGMTQIFVKKQGSWTLVGGSTEGTEKASQLPAKRESWSVYALYISGFLLIIFGGLTFVRSHLRSK